MRVYEGESETVILYCPTPVKVMVKLPLSTVPLYRWEWGWDRIGGGVSEGI